MAYKSPDKIYYDSATGSTFKEAFADARKEGKKIFEWNGKSYNTKLKGEGEPKQGKYKESDTIEAGRREKSAPKEEEKKEDKRSRGTAAALAAAGTALGTAALLGGMKKSEENRREREMAKGREDRSIKSPVRSISAEEAAWEGEGGRSFRKGGKIKKYAAGGMAENIPARSNMPQREKIPGGAPNKSGPSIPEWLQNERKNQEQDRRNRREREAYDKGEKTRLRDQGSFKKGGMTASRRGDGIAMRGKTKGRIV